MAKSRTQPEPSQGWESEIDAGQRFGFGANWAAYLAHLDDRRIGLAEASLKSMLDADRLDGRTFLDIGSGSGLFSLAARRLGATVTSFDFDPQSVGCTAELRRRYFPDDRDWKVIQGSVLDNGFMKALGTFDIVYSWGVLHHTGEMWQAIDNAAGRVAPNGTLFIAIYNDQGWPSRAWYRIKKAYVGTPRPLKWAILLPAFGRLWGPATIRDFLRGRPFHTWKSYGLEGSGRGMHPWRDVVDWVGGYPFEVAKPDEVFQFCRDRGFRLVHLRTNAGNLACNEFVFAREKPAPTS